MRCPGKNLFLLSAASLILAACGSSPDILASPELPFAASSTPSPLAATRTLPPTPTLTQTPSPSATPEPLPDPCDPFSADYCLVTGDFIFQPPISASGVDSIDRGYPFGGTLGGTREIHHGVEFHNPSGTPVLAAAAGRVVYAGDDTTRKFSPWNGFYGNLVVLEHTLGGATFETLYTLYAHLSKINVTHGQSVQPGDKIGEVGMTGTAAGSHLHFEVRTYPDDYATALNPEMWLIPHAGNGSLALLVQDPGGAVRVPDFFNVQYFPDRSGPEAFRQQVNPYPAEILETQEPWGEIAALGDQPAGWYRLTFIWSGRLYERWVQVQPMLLTLVLFEVK